MGYKKLFRSRTDYQISGLCGGIGEWIGIDSTIVRLAFVCLTLFAGMSVLVYLVGWLVVPEE